MTRSALTAGIAGLLIGVALTFLFVHSREQRIDSSTLSRVSQVAEDATHEEVEDAGDPFEDTDFFGDDWGEALEESPDAEVDRLVTENTALRKQISELLEWIRMNLPETATSPEVGRIAALDMPVLDAHLELNEAIADALQLNEQQYGAVTEVLRESYNGLLALRDEHTHIRQKDGTKMDITVRRFGEEGQQLESRLRSGLKSAMGEEKYEQFISAAGDGLARDYHYFGQARQNLRFQTFTSKDEGKPRIKIVDRYYFNQGGGSTTIKEYAGTFSILPNAYKAYIEWAAPQSYSP
ncbi:MAG: hypothetical protein KJ626_01755 [Verrucomicrobia bacterium]|nr:hypothetical protein [Verrucomicrobiota bacterium]